jgi:hypothetical protein
MKPIRILGIISLLVLVAMLFIGQTRSTSEGFTVEELQEKQTELQNAIDAAQIEYRDNQDYYKKVASAVQNVMNLQNEYSTDPDIKNDLAIQKILKDFNKWKAENIIQDQPPKARPTLAPAPSKKPSFFSSETE